MSVDAALVKRLASLASLALDEDEVSELTDDLSRIVEYVAILELADAGADVASAPAGRSPTGLGTTALRADEPRASLPTELALREAPRSLGGGFAVPGFVEEG